MTETEHYRLNLWEPNDRMERTAFNDNSTAIDAALAAKAEKSAVSAVETALANYKSSNDAAVAAKAEKSAVSAVETALANYKSSNDAAVAAKADASALTTYQTSNDAAVGNKASAAEVSALGQSVSALSAALGSKGNCRIATGSYVGTGAFGVDNPNSLTFDFCPQIIWFSTTALSNQYYNGFFVRPCTTRKGLDGYGTAVTWTDNAVSWYCTVDDGYNHAVGQNNVLNATYYWIAIGEE